MMRIISLLLVLLIGLSAGAQDEKSRRRRRKATQSRDVGGGQKWGSQINRSQTNPDIAGERRERKASKGIQYSGKPRGRRGNSHRAAKSSNPVGDLQPKDQSQPQKPQQPGLNRWLYGEWAAHPPLPTGC